MSPEPCIAHSMDTAHSDRVSQGQEGGMSEYHPPVGRWARDSGPAPGVFLNCCKPIKPQPAVCDDHHHTNADTKAGSAVPKGLSSRGPSDNSHRLCPI